MRLRRIPVGLRILTHTPGRLAVSLAGVGLAIVLMFSQAGFRHGVLDSQAGLIQRLNGDLFILGRQKSQMYVDELFPSRRLHQARICPGVHAVFPLYIEIQRPVWRNPSDGSMRVIRVLAFDPDDPVFDMPDVQVHSAALKRPDTVLFDRQARDYFGRPQTGTVTELSQHKVNVVGTFRLGTDFLSDGNLIMSSRNFAKFFPIAPGHAASHLPGVAVGVVQVAKDTDVHAVRQNLSRSLPADVKVLTKQELVNMEIRYWEENTAIVLIFTLGTVVGFFIGIVICYQILYSNVSHYLPQFATLKAMGFTSRYLVGIVMQQSIFLAGLAFLPALAAAQGLFWIVGGLTGLLMLLTPWRIAFILVLAVAMCAVSGIIAVRRVMHTDPAEVFK
ncbi:MAG: FtsX-like permease family protein [Planctomycetes bacterium]|nr:FtsX-like permease family protein [Planctomycetota bacterium]